jgi:hypothetical protein
MSWRFIKIFRFGRFRTSISKGGVGASWGIPGLRFGVSPTGRKYFSIGIPGTGLYFTKYISNQKPFEQEPNLLKDKKETAQKNSNDEPWWKQKNL